MAKRSAAFSVSWDRAAILALISDIKQLRTEGHLSYLAIIKSCLLPKHFTDSALHSAQQRFSRWLNHAEEGEKWRGIREAHFRKIAAYVFRIRQHDGGTDTGAVPDAMFFGLLAWMAVDKEAVADLRNTFPGEYIAYRHSLTAPGFVAVGTLTIEQNAITGAVATRERFVVPDPAGGPATSFEMKGYLVRKHGRYYIFALHDDDRDIVVQYSFIKSVARRGGVGLDRAEVVSISGVVSDIQGLDFYSCRFVYVKGRPKKLGVMMKVDDLPPRVRRDLETIPNVVFPTKDSRGFVVTF